jgi:hypothetical protein
MSIKTILGYPVGSSLGSNGACVVGAGMTSSHFSLQLTQSNSTAETIPPKEFDRTSFPVAELEDTLSCLRFVPQSDSLSLTHIPSGMEMLTVRSFIIRRWSEIGVLYPSRLQSATQSPGLARPSNVTF